MVKYLLAKEVVKNSFWIVESKGTNVGTLRHKADGYVFYENNSHTETTIDNLDRFRFEKQNQACKQACYIPVHITSYEYKVAAT